MTFFGFDILGLGCLAFDLSFTVFSTDLSKFLFLLNNWTFFEVEGDLLFFWGADKSITFFEIIFGCFFFFSEYSSSDESDFI